MLSKAVKICQKLLKTVKSCHKLSKSAKVVKKCQKLSKVVRQTDGETSALVELRLSSLKQLFMMIMQTLSFPQVSICNISCFDCYESAHISVSPSLLSLKLKKLNHRKFCVHLAFADSK